MRAMSSTASLDNLYTWACVQQCMEGARFYKGQRNTSKTYSEKMAEGCWRCIASSPDSIPEGQHAEQPIVVYTLQHVHARDGICQAGRQCGSIQSFDESVQSQI